MYVLLVSTKVFFSYNFLILVWFYSTLRFLLGRFPMFMLINNDRFAEAPVNVHSITDSCNDSESVRYSKMSARWKLIHELFHSSINYTYKDLSAMTSKNVPGSMYWILLSVRFLRLIEIIQINIITAIHWTLFVFQSYSFTSTIDFKNGKGK